MDHRLAYAFIHSGTQSYQNMVTNKKVKIIICTENNWAKRYKIFKLVINMENIVGELINNEMVLDTDFLDFKTL